MNKALKDKEKCLQKAPALQKTLPSDKTINETSQLMILLSHPTRLKILHALLQKDVCVCVLAKLAEKRQPNISQHLTQLRDSGIIEKYPKGKFTYYRLKDKKIIKTIKTLQTKAGT